MTDRGTGIILRRDSGLPAYRQLVDQLRLLIQVGRYREGDYLPPMREVAADVGLNLNTVNRAYQQLQRDGLIRSTPGKGAVVSSRAQTGSGTATATALARDTPVPADVRSILAAAVERAFSAGLDRDAVVEALDELLLSYKDRLPPRPRIGLLTDVGFRHEPLGRALTALMGTDALVTPVSARQPISAVDLIVRPTFGPAGETIEHEVGRNILDVRILPNRMSTERLLDVPGDSRFAIVAGDANASAWLIDLVTTLTRPGVVRTAVTDESSPISAEADEIVVAEQNHPSAQAWSGPIISVEYAFGDSVGDAIRGGLSAALELRNERGVTADSTNTA